MRSRIIMIIMTIRHRDCDRLGQQDGVLHEQQQQQQQDQRERHVSTTVDYDRRRRRRVLLLRSSDLGICVILLSATFLMISIGLGVSSANGYKILVRETGGHKTYNTYTDIYYGDRGRQGILLRKNAVYS